jgi:hypothetical protein
MAANVTDRLWEMGDIVDVLEAWEATNWRSGVRDIRFSWTVTETPTW